MKFLPTLGIALVLAGCSVPTQRTVSIGESQEAVRARLGSPATERKLASGDRAWYFVTAPSGFFTWQAVFDRDGRVTEYVQVLTRQNFDSLPQGASRDLVLDRLGPPMERSTFKRTATEAWTYRWKDGTFEMLANVLFRADGGGLIQVTLGRDPAFDSPAR
jgi:outer membrane protein assembly factor BamE (lipoprotein component of BamABCDE complex)